MSWCSWNIPYDFNNSDFSICNDILATYLSSYRDKTYVCPTNSHY
jgi:hypothetical protein